MTVENLEDALRDREQQDRAEREYERQAHDDHWDRFDPGPGAAAEEKARSGSTGPSRKPIRASAFQWRDPKTIPLRPWLYGNVYLREVITVTAGPGGYGKSRLVLVEAIAMASGRSLLGIQVTEPLRVWYVNLEDGREELERRVMAMCLHFGVTEADLGGRLFLDSGDDCRMVVVTETKEGARVAEPVVSEVVAEIGAHKIDVLMVDPFVSAHEVDENSNSRVNVVKNTFAGIARATKAAVGLVHHVRKGVSGQGAYTIDDSRGAKALVDGARVGRILNGMSAEDGEKAGVENPRVYFYITTGKANLAPAGDRREWYHIKSVSLGNGVGDGDLGGLIDTSDHVGVVETWEWPDPQANVTVHNLREVQVAMAGAIGRTIRQKTGSGTSSRGCLSSTQRTRRTSASFSRTSKFGSATARSSSSPAGMRRRRTAPTSRWAGSRATTATERLHLRFSPVEISPPHPTPHCR